MFHTEKPYLHELIGVLKSHNNLIIVNLLLLTLKTQ